MNYKAETTLNEKDSLNDLLIVEKALVKLYATAITEGCSNGFRKAIKKSLEEQIEDQISVFFFLTENDHARVQSATDTELKEAVEQFSKVKNELA